LAGNPSFNIYHLLISGLQRGLEELAWGWLDYYYDSDHVLYVLCPLKEKLGYIP